MSSFTLSEQRQYGATSSEVSEMSTGTSAGGMRGVGLIVSILGQMALQKKNLSLAKDYYNTNKRDYDFFNATHRGPMAQSVQEAFSPTANPEYLHDKYVSVPAAAARVADIDRKWLTSRRSLSRYAVGAGKRVDYEYAKQRASLMAANWYLGWRNELTYAQERNERRFNRKVNVVNVGIGAGNAVASGLASASANVMNANAGLANQFGSIAQGIIGKNAEDRGRADARSIFHQQTGR